MDESESMQEGEQMRFVRRSVLAVGTLLAASATWATPPATTVEHQVMVSGGLAAGHPFEAWLVFDKPSDPRVQGYSLPAGSAIRIRFPESFAPAAHGVLGAVMLTGWPQGSIAAKFTTRPDPADPRTIVIHFEAPIVASDDKQPGLKAIHLRTDEINPVRAGDYPITVQFLDAGPLTGVTHAVAHISAAPEPNVAAYNQLHQGENEDWQHVRAGEEASLPIDFLVTLPDENRSDISLDRRSAQELGILKDGTPIGTVTVSGVPVSMTPQRFGPGFARLGIVELRAKAGAMPGVAQIVAALDGGTRYVIHLVVEAP